MARKEDPRHAYVLCLYEMSNALQARTHSGITVAEKTEVEGEKSFTPHDIHDSAYQGSHNDRAQRIMYSFTVSYCTPCPSGLSRFRRSALNVNGKGANSLVIRIDLLEAKLLDVVKTKFLVAIPLRGTYGSFYHEVAIRLCVHMRQTSKHAKA